MGKFEFMLSVSETRRKVSIDNDDTRDIDQLTAAEMLPNGNVRILISVADCDFLVEKDCV